MPLFEHLKENFPLRRKLEITESEVIAAKDALAKLMLFLRDNTRSQMTQLIDITAVDHMRDKDRFTVIYRLLGINLNHRITVKVVAGDREIIPSIADIFPNSVWYEREIWDMFGIGFSGHPDLRRILSDEVFIGHPLRKDFNAKTRMVYDQSLGECVYVEP